MRFLLLTLAGALAFPGMANAINCSAPSQALPVRPTLLAPIASELVPPTSLLGARSGVLSQAYDEAQSVDHVLLRLRIEGCQDVAKAMPAPSAIDPNDPAAYKPKTEFDNTPWRFDMSQNGKRMTADEFSAWMKARGVPAAAPGAVPAGTAPATAPADSPPGSVPAPASAPAGSPPGMLPAPAPPAGSPPGTLPAPAPTPAGVPPGTLPAPATPPSSDKPTTP
jgi:hypothetical protein